MPAEHEDKVVKELNSECGDLSKTALALRQDLKKYAIPIQTIGHQLENMPEALVVAEGRITINGPNGQEHFPLELFDLNKISGICNELRRVIARVSEIQQTLRGMGR